ncbi:MAG: hypothetical protein JNN27_18530 [Planctomycetes bacterium]|nr:hypothetical protein [Planctomycetota bacterium]
MARDNIEWVRKNAEGEKIEIKAHQIRERWDFYWRPGRTWGWNVLETPLLEDWLEVLDGVERRVHRRQYPLDEPAKVRRLIRERYPDAEFD